ncbi:MAG: hypothetical protein ACK5W1_10970 [Flavobacteriales bacterium]
MKWIMCSQSWYRRASVALCMVLTHVAGAQSNVSECRQVDKGIHVIWLDSHANKAVVGEFKDFIVLMEFPQNDTVSNDMIDFLSTHFPKKPIRYVLHTHHHGHSASGFDPFIKRTKARLVTTPFNYDVIKSITQDSIALAQRLVLYDSTYTITDRFNTIEVHALYDDKYALPTPEYNIAYFPAQRVLVSGCIFNKPTTYFEVINQRKTALREVIRDKKLDPRLFIATNTSRANDFEDMPTREVFEESFEKGIVPEKFCLEWRKVPVEKLFASRDSIKQEIRKIPRSYDYLVLSNYLIGIHHDYLRAIALLKPLIEVHPEEALLYERAGYCYENMGMNLEAVAYYRKFISMWDDEEDIREIEGVIAKLIQ